MLFLFNIVLSFIGVSLGGFKFLLICIPYIRIVMNSIWLKNINKPGFKKFLIWMPLSVLCMSVIGAIKYMQKTYEITDMLCVIFEPQEQITFLILTMPTCAIYSMQLISKVTKHMINKNNKKKKPSNLVVFFIKIKNQVVDVLFIQKCIQEFIAYIIFDIVETIFLFIVKSIKKLIKF